MVWVLGDFAMCVFASVYFFLGHMSEHMLLAAPHGSQRFDRTSVPIATSLVLGLGVAAALGLATLWTQGVDPRQQWSVSGVAMQTRPIVARPHTLPPAHGTRDAAVHHIRATDATPPTMHGRPSQYDPNRPPIDATTGGALAPLWLIVPAFVGAVWMWLRRSRAATPTEQPTQLAMCSVTGACTRPDPQARRARLMQLNAVQEEAPDQAAEPLTIVQPSDATIGGADLSKFLDASKRTRLNGQYRGTHIGEQVTAYGWVQAYRNQGAIIFVDLRDREGVVQLRFDAGVGDGSAHELAKQLRAEWVVAATGEVVSRGANVTDKIPTGEVEILCSDLVVFSDACTPPFEIKDEVEVQEVLRLKHRYLDLRRPRLAQNLILRSKVNLLSRQYFADNGFLEVETPILGNPTPEGARDYLVPSRVHPGSYYALPQSPQQFKQMLMMSGVDRYMQICRCFRDEDLRADRQPEFTQLDLEMSFVTPADVRALLDGYVKLIWKEVLGVDVPTPLPQITYAEAMEKYGIDRPDLRFGLPLTDCTALMRDRVDFVVFKNALAAGGIVKALYIPDGKAFSRKDLDKSFPAEARPFGAKGVAWARVGAEGAWTGPVAKGVSEALRADLNAALGAAEGGLVLFCADAPAVANASLARLRVYAGERLGLLDPAAWAFTWVVDFPMFEYDAEEGRYYAMHHPFTSPRAEDLPLLATDPAKVLAQAYDLVLNGTELGGGSIRIHQSHVQDTVFRTLGLAEAEVQDKFGFFLRALQYGTPPHGGLALGLDRMLTYLCGVDSLRDVIAFPKTLRATDLLTGSPSEVDTEQDPAKALAK